MTEQEVALPRREFLKKAAIIGGGALAASQLGSLLVHAEHVPGHTTGSKTLVPAGGTIYNPKAGIEAMTFPNLKNVVGFSEKQINDHLKLYQGYVTKINQIEESLHAMTPNLSEVNATYHPFRELHVEKTYALNGVVLHEQYFGNMGAPNSQPGSLFQDLAVKEFGSWDAYKNHFLSVGKAMRGWALTGYNMRDHRIHNYGLDTHNQWVPVSVIPLLVMDVYEHAYMIDYGIDRGTYLNTFWQNIDWSVVESRLKTMVMHYDDHGSAKKPGK